MPITYFKISQFRNLDIEIELDPNTNIFYGQNAAGKTSLLEAIFYLGLGRSFRTHLHNRVINHHANFFSIFALFEETNLTTRIGISRNITGERQVQIDGEKIKSLSILARLLPIQLLGAESHRYFYDGPNARRKFIDWGVFHVEHTFLSQWQQLQQSLKQRNAALKSKLDHKEIRIWDGDIDLLANQIDTARQNYVAQLEPIFSKLITQFLPDLQLILRYSRGWPIDHNLWSILNSNFKRDQQLGYTQFGPHKADLQLYVNDIVAQDYLSQGQQKLTAYALHLAQGLLFKKLTQRSPIYLIDDLPAELDQDKRSKIANVFSELHSQVFVTGISIDDLEAIVDSQSARVFHVEQGKIKIASS